MKLRVASTIGKDTTMTVADSVFSVTVNEQLVAQAIRVFMSNQRQGTSKTKTRSEISRTHKKWYKQKGTGGARHGARTPGLFVGGGITHGPTGLQNWSLKMSSIQRQSALKSALSAQSERILICDDITQLDGKTSSAQKMLAKLLPDATRILVVLDKPSQMVSRSLRNLPRVFVGNSARLNTFEIASSDAIIFTKDSIKALEARLTKDAPEAKSDAPVAEEAVVAEKTVKAAPVKAVKAKTAKPAVKKVAAKK